MRLAYSEPEKIQSIDSEFLSGKRYPYQEDLSLVEDVDLEAATPGDDINWLEDIELLSEDGTPAVFDRYSNSFIKIHFPIPAGRENEIARKVLITHLQSGNSYGIQLKEKHCKFPQPELGPWVADRRPSAPTGSPRCSKAGKRRSIDVRRTGKEEARVATDLERFVEAEGRDEQVCRVRDASTPRGSRTSTTSSSP